MARSKFYFGDEVCPDVHRDGFTFYKREDDDAPLMIMMVGLPGSGKSTLARMTYVVHLNENSEILRPRIHSSDALRKEMFGDEERQGDNNKLFAELHRRIRKDLSDGKDVIYDATNIRKKERIAFLNSLKKIPCWKVALVVATEYERCLERNKNRERKVPEDVIRRMFLNWNPPHYGEGFDAVDYEFSGKYLSKDSYLKIADSFDQENHHHRHTLGEHSRMVKESVVPHGDYCLTTAALLHDVGKLVTKTRGEDGDCHYYNHHCVGAYNAMFYLQEDYPEDITDIVNLIYYHMHPFNAWKSERARLRDKELLGEELFKMVMLIHKADKEAT